MKKRNEDEPDNLGGLSDLLSAKVLKMINELLEQLQQTGHVNKDSSVINIYAFGSQHIDTQVIASPCPETLPSPFCLGREKGMEDTTPPSEAMARAVEKTMAQGYWWASTAWAVVYRVYQMKGYGGGFSQFVKEVATWPRTRQWEMECNFDAVQKPVSSGRLSGMPETWRANGAQEQATKLAFALMEELQSCRK